MNQPELGITVAELRGKQGLTQERLAEYCEVSTRTIQRIESGEVDPRAFTRNNLSNILDFDFVEENSQNETMWLTILHLSCILGNVIIPLFIWSWKKNKSHKINTHGRHVLNFQVTITLMLFVALFFLLIMIGIFIYIDETGGTTDLVYTALAGTAILPFIIIGMFSIYQGVVNTLRMLADEPIRYRLSIPFVK
jgi:uncharacterized Tic20 family protein